MLVPSPSISPADAARRNAAFSAARPAIAQHESWLLNHPHTYKLATGNLPVLWAALVAQGKQADYMATATQQVASTPEGTLDRVLSEARLASAKQFFTFMQAGI